MAEIFREEAQITKWARCNEYLIGSPQYKEDRQRGPVPGTGSDADERSDSGPSYRREVLFPNGALQLDFTCFNPDITTDWDVRHYLADNKPYALILRWAVGLKNKQWTLQDYTAHQRTSMVDGELAIKSDEPTPLVGHFSINNYQRTWEYAAIVKPFLQIAHLNAENHMPLAWKIRLNGSSNECIGAVLETILQASKQP